MKTVLVSGASGIVGYGILRSLRQSPRPLQLVGSSIHPSSPANAFADHFELAPRTDDPGYLGWLLSLIERQRVDLVIPGIECDLQHWTEHRPAIEAAGAVAMLNDPALIRACADKWVFHRQLAEAGLGCAIETTLEADFDALAARFGLPFIVKPRRGYASKGLRRIAHRADFDACRGGLGNTLMAQRLVGHDDEEYTLAAFGDGRGGHGLPIALRRRLSAEGYTETAEVVPAAPFAAALTELCRLFRPVGPTNFQFRLDGGEAKLLEINPRISSSTSIRTAFDYNEAAMAVDHYLYGTWPATPRLRGGRAVRYTEDHVSYDDRLHL